MSPAPEWLHRTLVRRGQRRRGGLDRGPAALFLTTEVLVAGKP
ncbi:MAG TPA: hypothetical protein VFM54_21885 [Micromonosporaceae bacterium]|nr:hypothetical protein [Micromonosporaceae bacterium]